MLLCHSLYKVAVNRGFYHPAVVSYTMQWDNLKAGNVKQTKIYIYIFPFFFVKTLNTGKNNQYLDNFLSGAVHKSCQRPKGVGGG